MSSQPKPYIGLTGITTPQEATDLKESISGLSLDASSTPRLMLGLLASLKTVSGNPVPNKRYPKIQDLPEIASLCSSYSFTTLHYNSHIRDNLADQISKLLDIAPSTHGVQLNIRTPLIDEIKAIRSRHPNLEIILQVNFSSLQKLFGDQSAKSATSYVATYAPYINHALFDLSGGRGTPINLSWAKEILVRLQDSLSTRSVLPGLAGGFGDTQETKSTLTILQDSTKVNFSIDAESLVRRPAINPIPAERFQDDLDLQKSLRYLTLASSILQSTPQPTIKI